MLIRNWRLLTVSPQLTFHALETTIQSWLSISWDIYQALIVLRSRQTNASGWSFTWTFSCFTSQLHCWHYSESVFWRALTFFLLSLSFISAEPHPSNVERHSQKTVWILFYDRRHQQLCITQQRYLVLQQIFSWMTQTTWLLFTKTFYSCAVIISTHIMRHSGFIV